MPKCTPVVDDVRKLWPFSAAASLRAGTIDAAGIEEDVPVSWNRTGRAFQDALDQSRILEVLKAFDPHVAGTPSLGLAVPTSDIDILCEVPRDEVFVQLIWETFSDQDGFAIRQWTANGRPVVASFVCKGWKLEIFGDRRPVEKQEAWIHFSVERRLLEIGGEDLKNRIMTLRREGFKTEAAFASVLGLAGDPFSSMLDLGQEDDASLQRRIAKLFPAN